MDYFFLIITWLGSLAVLLPGAVITVFAMSKRLSRADVLFFIGGLTSVSLITHIAKIVVSRPRPMVVDEMLVTMPSDLSFPSAHTSQATFFWLALAYIIARGKAMGIAVPVWLICGLLAILVAVSRVYLKVHYISDVIAGAALAVFWLLLLHRILKHFFPGDVHAK